MIEHIKNFLIIILLIIVLYVILAIIEINLEINFHKYYNPILYKESSFFEIPNISNKKKLEFSKNINIGKEIANDSKIVICSLARNVSLIFEKSKKRIEYIGKNFKEYKIVIFENDSSDNSRELLKNWSYSNNNVILLDCCKLGNCECKLKTKTGYEYGASSKNRFEKMAIYRQEYINYINKNINN